MPCVSPQMACSTIRYGKGVTQEIGMDMVNMKAKKVCVMTDPFLTKLPPVRTTIDSLTKYGVNFELYDRVRVEPTERRFVWFSKPLYVCRVEFPATLPLTKQFAGSDRLRPRRRVRLLRRGRRWLRHGHLQGCQSVLFGPRGRILGLRKPTYWEGKTGDGHLETAGCK